MQEFNHYKVKAKEMVTFDCRLMELKEIDETEINPPGNDAQLLAIIMRPEIEPNDLLEKNRNLNFAVMIWWKLLRLQALLQTLVQNLMM